jgi:glycosyltransferase involved in cell wall biosynthesis
MSDDFKKLKITHVTAGRCRENSLHGVDCSLFQFATNLAAMGHQVRFVGASDQEPHPMKGVKAVSARPHRFPLFSSREFRDEVLRNEPDVIHLHGAYVPAVAVAARIARKAGIPYVVTPHGNLAQRLLKRRPYLKYPYRALVELPMLEGAMFVHAIADREVIREYGVTRPIEEAHNGVDLPGDYLPEAGRPALSKLGVEPGKKCGLFVGRLDIGQKGLDELIDGFAIAARKNPALHLIMAGTSWKGGREQLEYRVAELGIEDAVTFPGAVFAGEKDALLKECDFFLHPSRWEAGVPFAALEALSFAKPCLVSRAVDREGILEKCQAARLVEVSAESIAGGIEALVAGDVGELAALGDRAREVCRNHFSWEASCVQLTESYLKHLKEGRWKASSNS